jgi:NTP pyrophosphatase (non-canonical NTP hydrolase)
MPEYPNLDELFNPKTEPNYEPGKDNPEPELRERMKELTERTRNPMIRNLSLTFAELREANVARCNDVFHKFEDWSHADWAVALTGEVGELCNLLKKARRGEKIKLLDMASELADIMIYLDLLAASLEVDLAREVIIKFNEVSDKRGSNIKL